MGKWRARKEPSWLDSLNSGHCITSDTVEFKRPHLSDNTKESHVFRPADLSSDLRLAEAAKEMLAHHRGEVALQTRKVRTKK